MSLKVADIYCGAGGLSKGFELARIDGLAEDARFEVIYGVDKDRDCMDTFHRNHFAGLTEETLERAAPCRSTTGLTAAEVLKATQLDHVNVVVGGPNCQGVSAAGLRNAADPRNERFEEFLALVSGLRPEWFVMENVPGLTHKNNRHLLHTIIEEFAALPGYEVAADVLLATDFGCAQLRYRLFIVGTRTGAPIRFPHPTHARPIAAGKPRPLLLPLAPCPTVEDAIGYLRNIPAAVATGGGPFALIDDQGNRIEVANHVVPMMSEENRARIKAIGQGEDWRAMPVGLLPERFFSTRASDQKGTYGRLSWKYPAFTIISLAGNVSAGPFTHPSLHRPISVREAADLQGFPKDFVFEGEVGSLYRQVGNAVPPPLARAMAEMILLCHHRPEEARAAGREGRITLSLFEQVERGKAFPVLTPRHLLTKPARRGPHAARRPALAKDTPHFAFVEDPAEAERVLPAANLSRLRREAELPGNMRAGKRARAILGYIEGKTLEELCSEAKVSTTSVKKWVEGFYHSGSDGWRAYHTPLAALAGDDPRLLAEIQGAIAEVRDHDEAPPSPAKDGRRDDSRPHMNLYLRHLIERFGDQSVGMLIARVSKHLGRDVGTVYVGDLLALCDILLGDVASPRVLDAGPKSMAVVGK